MYIKIRFVKNDKPTGREYSYSAPNTVCVGDKVILPSDGSGVVTKINVP